MNGAGVNLPAPAVLFRFGYPNNLNPTAVAEAALGISSYFPLPLQHQCDAGGAFAQLDSSLARLEFSTESHKFSLETQIRSEIRAFLAALKSISTYCSIRTYTERGESLLCSKH